MSAQILQFPGAPHPTMTPYDAQIAIEQNYSKKHINPLMEQYVLASPEITAKIDVCYQHLAVWLEQPFYASKILRLSKLRRLKPEQWRDLLVSMTAGLMHFQEPTQMVNAIPQICNSVNWGDKADAIVTASEMMICFRHAGLIDIGDVPATGKGAQYGAKSLGLVFLHPLPPEIKAAIDRARFLPPMVTVPAPASHTCDGHYTFKASPILGSGNRHDDHIAFDVLDMIAGTALHIDMDFLKICPEVPGSELDTPEKVSNWERYIKACHEVYEMSYRLSQNNVDTPGAVFIPAAYDKRGRGYTRGYEVNIQGSPQKKAMLEFWHVQHIDVPVQYQLVVG